MAHDPDDHTLPAHSVDETLPSTGAAGVSSGTEETLAPGSVPASGGPSSVIRAGGAADYGTLVPVDPRHYVVGKEIARGGMGRILTARDRRLGRQVAIKELLRESTDARARFEREARITAKLQHPAIVNIHEAGSWPGGEPFYVMKLVTGESLDHVIAARPQLSDRLALLPTVIACVDALAYAHAHRVIHRDLKPANVLVGEFGETVVIDWGLAKDLADDSGEAELPVGPYRGAVGETVVGSVMGTPAYMPVEQASGETVDERADVYALGAILYHVLAGSPPYTGKSTDDVLAAVIRGEAPPLAGRVAGVPPDLVTIVEKAMAHDRANRYATASELAADLKRFQTGQLVGAHHYSSWALVRRWLRRHRAPVAVAAALSLVLAVGATLSVRRIVEERNTANQQRASAEQARRDADAQRAAADGRRVGAEKIISFMIGDLQAKLTTLGKLEILSGLGKVILDYYDTVGDDAASSPSDLAGQARAFGALAVVEEKKGNDDDSLALWQRALGVFTALVAREPDSAEWWHGKASALQALATAYRNRGDTARIAESQEAALDAGRHAYQLDPGNREQRRSFAVALATTADNLTREGHADQGLALLREAEPLFAAATEDADDATRVSAFEDLLTIKAMLLSAIAQTSPLEDARAAGRDDVALVADLQRRYPDAVQFRLRAIALHLGLGDVEFDAGHHPEALVEYRAAVVSGEEVLRIEPAQKYGLDNYYFAQSRIASTLERMGRFDEALAAYQAVTRLDEERAAHDPTDHVAAIEVAIALQGTANVAVGLHRDADVVRYAGRAIAVTEQVIAAAGDGGRLEWRSTLAQALLLRAPARIAVGDRPGAEADARRALTVARQVAGEAPDYDASVSALADTLHRVAGTLATLGHRDEARALLDEAVTAAGTAVPASAVAARALLFALEERADLEADGEPAAAQADRQRALDLITALEQRGDAGADLALVRARLGAKSETP